IDANTLADRMIEIKRTSEDAKRMMEAANVQPISDSSLPSSPKAFPLLLQISQLLRLTVLQ
ncbi:hypothetical protein U1Q18_018808, partial [Sarracenia purpurea var. burkii]